MDRKYNLRLDLQFRCNNSVMKFRQSDNRTSDFFMRITSGGELFNIDNAIVILAVIKPNQAVQSQFLEVKEGKVYADLNPNMKDQVGIYKAQALLVYEDERVSTDVIEYEVLEDNILNQLESSVSTTEDFTMLQQMLSRLSIVENSENLRVENENSRVESEKLREQAIEKIKNDATKLITDTKKEINDYKDAKDIAIELNLNQYKEATTQDINDYKNTKNTEIDNYKNAKDLAIDNDLKQYKTNTTEDITQFKNTKNNELDEYKNAKNLEIDNYVINKNLEIDNYKSAKDIEIDNYKKLKDTEINAKLGEVDTAETLRVAAEQKRVIDHQSREEFLNSFEGQLAHIENEFNYVVANVTNGNESTTNTEIVLARGGKTTLKEKLDETDGKISVLDSQLEHNVKNLSKNYYTKAQSRANTNDIPINVSEFDTETKKLLTGGSVAVVGENSVGKENLKLKSVGVYNTDFAEIGKNLFDKSKISEKGWYMQYTNGKPVSNEYVTQLCYSDYMPVIANEKYITNEYIHSYCIFDVNKSFISGGIAIKKECIITIPSDGAYLVINPNYSEVDKVQTEHGEIITSYEPYSYNFKNAKVNYEVEKVKSELESTINGFNIINNKFDNISSYKDISIDTGTYTTPRDAISTFTGWAIPFSKSDLLEDITYISLYATAYDNATDKNILSNVSVNLELLDENRNVLKVLGKGNLVESGKIEFKLQIPLDDLPSIFFLGLRATQKCVLMLWNGEQNPNYTFGDKLMFYSTSYEDSINIYAQSNTNSYGITDIKIGTGAGLNIPEHRHKASDIEGIEDILLDNKVKLSLPDKYELVVGDTFELFYKGILLCNNPYNYNFKITCSKGSYYSKRYIYTPIPGDIGTHNLMIEVYDDNEKLLDSKTIKLIVKDKAKSPSTVKNVLCVGDSLTSNGAWASEVCRRLTGNGGSPSGDALTNVKFIGSLSGTSGAKYEGYGGWTYGNYNGNNVALQNYWINTNANKGITYQKSVWQDSNGVQWVLETIESNRIKIYRNVYGTQLPPASGTLTWVSGGDGSDNEDIVYTSYVAESGNPFWDDSTSSVDFKNYTTKLGVSSIDYCYVLLGWNQTGNTETQFKDSARTFINNLFASFPNCKITLMGLQVPSLDGFGANYGCGWNYYDKLKVVFNMNKWNYDLAQEFDNVDFVNIAGQFDSENNIMTSTRQVNVRNSKTEVYGSNGVHPAYEGNMQIADAVYRHLTHKL